MKHFAGNKV